MLSPIKFANRIWFPFYRSEKYPFLIPALIVIIIIYQLNFPIPFIISFIQFPVFGKVVIIIITQVNYPAHSINSYPSNLLVTPLTF